MPNLLPFRPVEIYGCVFGSTSGLTRKEMGAFIPRLAATSLSLDNSGIDSRLKHFTPALSAAVISALLLPTPEKTTFWAEPPAANTRANSPELTISNPAPNLANTFKMAKLLLAFMA